MTAAATAAVFFCLTETAKLQHRSAKLPFARKNKSNRLALAAYKYVRTRRLTLPKLTQSITAANKKSHICRRSAAHLHRQTTPPSNMKNNILIKH